MVYPYHFTDTTASTILVPKIWTPKCCQKRESNNNNNNYFSLLSLNTILGLDGFLLVITKAIAKKYPIVVG